MARQLVFMALFIVGKIMVKIICTIALLLVVSCTGIRDRNTYNMELIYIEAGLTRQGELVREYLRSTCCEGRVFQESMDCHSALDTYVTVQQRTPYHLGMMRYLGRLSDSKPELPAIILEGALLCE